MTLLILKVEDRSQIIEKPLHLIQEDVESKDLDCLPLVMSWEESLLLLNAYFSNSGSYTKAKSTIKGELGGIKYRGCVKEYPSITPTFILNMIMVNISISSLLKHWWNIFDNKQTTKIPRSFIFQGCNKP